MSTFTTSTSAAIVQGDLRCKLFFGGLPAKTDVDDLVEIASPYGTIVDHKILNRTGKKVCGFVVFSCCEEASACIAELGEGNQGFNVEYAKAPTKTSGKKGKKVKKNKKEKKARSSPSVSPNQQFFLDAPFSPNQMISPFSDFNSEFASPQGATPFSPGVMPQQQPQSLYVQDQFGNVFAVVRQDEQPLFPCNMQQNQMMPNVFFQQPQMPQMQMSPDNNAFFC